MERSEFLKEISLLSREEINKIIERDCKRIKKICPVIILQPEKYRRKDKDK